MKYLPVFVATIFRFSFLLFTAMASSAVAQSAASETHVVYAPVAGIEGFRVWELDILNRSPKPQTATVTVYSADGSAFPSSQISLQGQETRRLDIASLVPEGMVGHTLGGMAIQYEGPPMLFSRQIVLSDFSTGGGLDVPFAENTDLRPALSTPFGGSQPTTLPM